MEMTLKIEGLDEAMKALQAAFPKDPKRQRSLLNQAMSQSAKQTIVPVAKSLALQGDGSGSLSEAIKPRAVSAGRSRAAGVPARVQVTPVRMDRKAIAMYIDYYYNRVGRAAPSKMVTSGIRHGHLVEFGHRARNGEFVSAQPFMGPALDSAGRAYIRRFASNLERKVEAAVRRARKR